MKRFVFLLLAAALLGAPAAQAANVGFNLDMHIGNHPEPPIVVHQRPVFLAPAELDFHVAVGVPYDMFMVHGDYYVCRGDRWYRSHSYNGPWQGVRRKHLPPGLAKRRYADIIHVRDVEYVRYKKDKHHYKGRGYYADDHDDDRRHGRGNGKGKKYRD
jgi:hypothetical protein